MKFSGGVIAPENFETENSVLVDFGFASTFDPAQLDRDLGVGFTGTAAIGFRPMDRLRLEFEAGYSRSKADMTVFTRDGEPTPATRASETDLTLFNGMANSWFDVARFDSVSLFLGAGVGISYVDMNSIPADPEPVLPEVFLPDESDDTIAFAWQAGGGLSVQISESWGPLERSIAISIRWVRIFPDLISPGGVTLVWFRFPTFSAGAPSTIPMATIAAANR